MDNERKANSHTRKKQNERKCARNFLNEIKSGKLNTDKEDKLCEARGGIFTTELVLLHFDQHMTSRARGEAPRDSKNGVPG